MTSLLCSMSQRGDSFMDCIILAPLSADILLGSAIGNPVGVGRSMTSSFSFSLCFSTCFSGRGCVPLCPQFLQTAPPGNFWVSLGPENTLPLAFSSQMFISGYLIILLSVPLTCLRFYKYSFILVSSVESSGLKFCFQPAMLMAIPSHQ